MSPETIGKYRLEAPLGEGSSGVVYRAIAQDTNQPVALKIIPIEKFASSAARQKFLAEARAAAPLSHPHLRQLYEAGESGDKVYLAMEHLEGSTLRSLLVGGALDPETALEWGAEISEALAAAHAASVVHGELTAGKIFITQQGTVKLLDVGLWRAAIPTGVDLSQETRLREANLRPAMVAAMAPEQIRGKEPDARSDVFALAALLYEMMTGRNPFADQNPVQSMYWVLHRTPEPLSQRAPQAPPALDRVFVRAFEKEPKARYRTAGELAAALRAVAAGEELPPEEAPKRAVVVRVNRPVWVGVGVGVVFLLAWIAYLVLLRP